MKLGLLITGGLALVLAAALVLGVFLPKSWEASATGVVEATEAEVRAALSQPRAWSSWTPWPEGGAAFSGPESGPGATRSWDDELYGAGSFSITDAREGRVGYRVVIEEGRFEIDGTIDLSPTAEGTRVEWVERGDFGRNPLLALVSRRMPEQQSAALAESIEALAAALSGASADTIGGSGSAAG